MRQNSRMVVNEWYVKPYKGLHEMYNATTVERTSESVQLSLYMEQITVFF
jgi:hypothetical protein